MPQAASPHFERADAPELRQMLERMARCRALFPAVWAKFWCAEGVRCVLCGRVGDFLGKKPDGTGIMNVAMVTAPDSAARRALALGGLDALYYTDIEPGEVWFGWCTRCTPPQSHDEWELLAQTVQRRAAGAV